MNKANTPVTRWPITLAANVQDWPSLNCGFCGTRLLRADSRPRGLFNLKVIGGIIEKHRSACGNVYSVAT